jgi:hypothetical protein
MNSYIQLVDFSRHMMQSSEINYVDESCLPLISLTNSLLFLMTVIPILLPPLEFF